MAKHAELVKTYTDEVRIFEMAKPQVQGMNGAQVAAMATAISNLEDVVENYDKLKKISQVKVSSSCI